MRDERHCPSCGAELVLSADFSWGGISIELKHEEEE